MPESVTLPSFYSSSSHLTPSLLFLFSTHFPPLAISTASYHEGEPTDHLSTLYTFPSPPSLTRLCRGCRGGLRRSRQLRGRPEGEVCQGEQVERRATRRQMEEEISRSEEAPRQLEQTAVGVTREKMQRSSSPTTLGLALVNSLTWAAEVPFSKTLSPCQLHFCSSFERVRVCFFFAVLKGGRTDLRGVQRSESVNPGEEEEEEEEEESEDGAPPPLPSLHSSTSPLPPPSSASSLSPTSQSLCQRAASVRTSQTCGTFSLFARNDPLDVSSV
ncbi:unnamed protein product [Pleuronectes platessa]|uniref:Uncharacterized protein n=1 Tax=Pleuronectes platessa TaxID=8262 RepID=A0A9N7UCV0_PLEPL|nr:unnamed protein product [Pleuronectes platessa]